MRPLRSRLAIVPVLALLAGAVAAVTADEGGRDSGPPKGRPVVADPWEEPSPQLERLAIPRPSGRADLPLVAPLPVSPSR